MSGCPGAHCPGCGRGGGGLVAAVVLVVVLASSSAVATAVADLLIAAFVAVGVITVGSVGVLAFVLHRDRLSSPYPARPELPPVRVRVLPARPAGARQVPARVVRGVVLPPARADVPALPRGDASTYPRENAHPHVVTSRTPRPRCTHRPGRRS